MSSCELKNRKALETAASLLGVDADGLEESLTKRNVTTRREVVQMEMDHDQAEKTRDATCKALYSRLFAWLVKRVNQTISVSCCCDLPQRSCALACACARVCVCVCVFERVWVECRG